MTVSVGFIGAGGIASIHLETFDAVVDGYDIELAAVADVDEERARTAADSRDGTAYTDGEELIKSEPLDALVVAVPPFAHGNYERMAAARGIDLFIEKPVGLSLDRARETAQHVEGAGILAQVGYVCRYGRITERAQELLDGRRIGHIDSTYWVSPPETPWWCERARSGGQIVEQSTHVYDLHRYLAGEVTAATGSGTDRVLVDSVDFQDATSVTLEHESGAVSHVSSTCASPVSRFEVRVAAENASLELDYFEHSLSGSVDGEPIQFEGAGDWYHREFETFLRAISSESTDVRSEYDDAVRTLELTLTARAAAEAGNRTESSINMSSDISDREINL